MAETSSRQRAESTGLSNTHRSMPRADVTARARDLAAVLLAVVSGATDAIGFVALGGAFTSVMTGNMVLLGIGAAQGDRSLATNAAGAIGCYILGCVAGTRLAGTASDDGRTWPPSVTRALAVEAAVILAFAIAWWCTGSRPAGDVQLPLLVANSFALGIQSSAVQRFGVPGLSTTYMTGTLTTVVVKLTSGRRVRDVAHSGQILSGLIGGAVVATTLVKVCPAVAPLLQIGCLATALMLGLRASTRRAAMPAVADEEFHY
jgi:uncharacterized membrane protein YoaK (UPF0700 family)